MKTTIVAVLALTAASVCAQPIVVPTEHDYAGFARAVADLEARGWGFNWRKIGNFAKHLNLGKIGDFAKHVNWGKVGNFAKDAAKVGASILLKRMDEDELYARGFIYKDEFVTRDFDDYLEQRDLNLELRDEQDDGDRPLARPHHRPHHHHHHPHRWSGHGESHKQGGFKSGKAYSRRPSRLAGNLDDLD